MHTIDNPESLSTRLIYNYDTKANQTWNIQEYKTPREYLDPVLQVKQRQWAVQKKGQKSKKYQTKRGFYMDYHIKVGKSVPGPDKHGSNSPWSFEKQQRISKHRNVDPKLKKNTYLEQIEIQQKSRKKPGICTYSLEKSMKQKDALVELMKKKKSFVGEKHFFHQDIEFLGDKSPGAGAHNPHDDIKKIRKNKTDYKDWVKKHQLQFDKISKRDSSKPAPGTYSPMNATFTTFEHIEKKKNKSNQKIKGFGTDARFEYTRPEKKKIIQKRPDPISYNTAYEWRKTSPVSKNKPWNQSLHKGYRTLSVYH